MKWGEFIRLVGKLPVVDTEILLAGVKDPKPAKVQISRWRRSVKLIQLKRGIYLLAEPYRKVEVYAPYLAAVLKKPSYISLEKALEFHNLIPEGVRVYTSVTTKRTARVSCAEGVFDYKHIKKSLFFGYGSVTVNGQTAFIASPEKALLDLVYFTKEKVSYAYLEGLRLQDTKVIDSEKLSTFARRFKKPKVARGAKIIREYINSVESREREL